MYGVPDIYIHPLCGFPSDGTDIMGVEENYLDTVDLKFYNPTELDDSFKYSKILPNGKYNGFEGLFTDAGIEELVSNDDNLTITSNNVKR